MTRNQRLILCGALIAAILLIRNVPSLAFIQRLYSLKEVMDASAVIAVGEIESIDQDEKWVIAKVNESVKGKCPYKTIRMNIAVGHEWFPEACMKRLKVGDPVLFFYALDGNLRPCLAYATGVFIQIYGNVDKDPENPWWLFTHIELLMTRTYNGATPDLIATVKDVLAGKVEPPAPDEKRAPLTKEELLGKKAAQNTAAKVVLTDAVDGYEAGSWPSQNWAKPAIIEMMKSETRGKVLRVEYNGEPEERKGPPKLGVVHDPEGMKIQNKVAVARFVAIDSSGATRLLFEASNQSEKVLRLSVGIHTMDWQYFESPIMELAPGQRKLDLSVDLTASNFKCDATKWQFTSKLLNRDHISRLTFVSNEPPLTGMFYIDRVRLDSGNIFIRSIPLPRAGAPAGVSWTDVDGDGLPDAFVCGGPDEQNKEVTAQNRLFRNNAGEFENITEKLGLKGASRFAAWADYNGDGLPDLLCSEPAMLWTNAKAGFTDEFAALLPGLAKDGQRGAAAWIDSHGSGRADLLFAGEQGLSLFSNSGTGPNWFAQNTAGAASRLLAIADCDGDGFSDIVCAPALLHNSEGKSFQPAAKTGIDFSAYPKSAVAFGDFDNDGNLDVFIAGEKCALYRNNNDGTFSDVTVRAHVFADLPHGAQCAAWGDVDMDGRLDLVVGFADAPAQIFLNMGGGRFAEGISLEPFKCAFGVTGMAFADFDGDGDLDLLMSGKETAGILVNGCPRSSKNVGLRIRVPFKEAPGALVRLYDAADRSLGIRQLGLMSNTGCQDNREAHFAVEPGTYKAAVLLTNGTVRQKTLNVDKKGLLWDINSKEEPAAEPPAPAKEAAK